MPTSHLVLGSPQVLATGGDDSSLLRGGAVIMPCDSFSTLLIPHPQVTLCALETKRQVFKSLPQALLNSELLVQNPYEDMEETGQPSFLTTVRLWSLAMLPGQRDYEPHLEAPSGTLPGSTAAHWENG